MTNRPLGGRGKLVGSSSSNRTSSRLTDSSVSSGWSSSVPPLAANVRISLAGITRRTEYHSNICENGIVAALMVRSGTSPLHTIRHAVPGRIVPHSVVGGKLMALNSSSDASAVGDDDVTGLSGSRNTRNRTVGTAFPDKNAIGNGHGVVRKASRISV